jgi:RHS repeat-associated protein
MTGMLVRNLETGTWYKSTHFVDYKGRIIQQHSQNNVGGIDRMDYQYRFNNEVLKMRMTHRKTGAKDLTELYQYAYDHAGRKTSFTHNNLVVAKYEYDGIGRLQNKKFRPIGTTQGSKQTGNWTDASSWLSGVFPLANDNVTINTGHILTIPSGQSGSAGTLNDRGTLRNFGTLNMGKVPTADLYEQRFLYHIRGGIRGYNLDANGDLTNSLFSFKLSYEEGTGGYFDGNIRNQYWKSNIDGVQRAYEYSYDKASRIISGAYGSTKAGENYALNGITYDFNGNITTLSRNGYKSNNTFGLVDNLGYAYQTNSNKIQSVSDNSGEIASFTDAAGATDYTYNLDGSLASDANKGITLIEYNYLKLPKRIVKGSTVILNQYDATGRKIKETIGSNTTDYIGNKIYKNGVLYQISHDEGRIIDGQYEYNLRDHLGNLRVAFRDSSGVAKITQANSYGCWGEVLPTLSYLKSSWKEDKFRFTGQENLPETGYADFRARLYDNLVPRFITIDPLSEKYPGLNGYNYVANNPILLTDPFGTDIKYNWGTHNYEEDGTVVGNQYAVSTIKNGDNTSGAIALGNGRGNVAFINHQPWESVNYSSMKSDNENWDFIDVESGNIKARSTAIKAYNFFFGDFNNVVFFSHGIARRGIALYTTENYKNSDIYTGYTAKEYIESYQKDENSVSFLAGFMEGLKEIVSNTSAGGNLLFYACDQSGCSGTKPLVNYISSINPNINIIFQDGHGFAYSNGQRPRQNIAMVFGENISFGSGFTMFNSSGTKLLNSVMLNKKGTPMSLK